MYDFYEDPWNNPYESPWWEPYGDTFFFQEEDSPNDAPSSDGNMRTYIANTWGFFDTDDDGVHDQNEIFLFADEELTVEDVDGTADDFFSTFTPYPAS